jgi:tetratricopeptide (TPR) repeat protein
MRLESRHETRGATATQPGFPRWLLKKSRSSPVTAVTRPSESEGMPLQRKAIAVATIGALLLFATAARSVDDHAHDETLGTVSLTTSCQPEANAEVKRGLAMLHHMMYDIAEEAFAAAVRSQPDCAMGLWGQAMSMVHPLWSDPPNATRFEQGRALVSTALQRGTKAPRERAYIQALHAYFEPGHGNKESINLRAFARGWAEVHKQYPNDPEATLFHALAQLATADPADKAFAQQRRAGEMIEAVFARYSDHPGAHHYLIHAYDYPPLASRALGVARDYGKIAPEVPHALHMPTHIFTRLGLWEDVIAWNTRSAAAALKRPVAGAVSLHYLHALDYLAYAHLQRGDDTSAAQVREKLDRLRTPVQTELASAYAFAAVPARLALERQHWREAAALPPRMPAWYPWESVPAVEAITQFARALGAARSGDAPGARTALRQLESLRDRASLTNEYWAKQVEIQRLAALAWVKQAEGERAAALDTMRQAAALEATTEKHPVTPGEVLPAQELLGDMLLEQGAHAQAQAAYEATLARSPNRFNSIFGAGRAAELRGDAQAAARFYQQLLALAAKADPVPERLQHARRFMATSSGASSR